MNLVLYFSMSKNKRSKAIAESMEGTKVELKPVGKVYKSRFMQMFMYGYYTTSNKNVKYDIEEIDYSKYDTIYLVSPVWAGRPCQYVRKCLESKHFLSKKVVLIGSCEGGYSKYFDSYQGILDESNEIIDKQIYVNGEKIVK